MRQVIFGHYEVGGQFRHIARLNFVSFKNDFYQKKKDQGECVKKRLIAKARRQDNGHLKHEKPIAFSFSIRSIR